ncbi:MAG: peptidoglycan DD-metalloendopeptidase family protein [Methylococcales bacterium]
MVKTKLNKTFLLGLVSVAATTTTYAKPNKYKAHSPVIIYSKHIKKTHQSTILHRIRPGETIFSIFSKLNLSQLELEQIINANDAGKQFEEITPGNTLLVKTNRFGELDELSYQTNPFTTLVATRNIGDFTVRLNTKISSYNPLITANTKRETSSFKLPYKKAPSQVFSAQAIVQTSLEEAGQQAGLSNNLITQLTDIFAWDIDFASQIRSGDRFTVVYEKAPGFDNNEIVAAEVVVRGKAYIAVRYEDENGNTNYYTPDGKAMRKAFLSTPVDFARISSHFDSHRRHPVLNRIRAHKGVDYAARTGTPVKSTGDGKVVFLGRQGGYGQVIIIEHGQHYETVYAHLSNFKRALQEGDTVKQGEVIGYVGQTGLATGPHLHYEFRVDGMHQDPLTAQATQSQPISNEVYAEFRQKTQFSLMQLNKAKARSLFAKNQNRYNY